MKKVGLGRGDIEWRCIAMETSANPMESSGVGIALQGCPTSGREAGPLCALLLLTCHGCEPLPTRD